MILRTFFFLSGCRWKHLSHGQLLLLQCLQLSPEQHGANPQDLQHTGRLAEGHAGDQRCTSLCYCVSVTFSFRHHVAHTSVVNDDVLLRFFSLISLSLQRSLFMLPTGLARSRLWKLTFCISYPACTLPLGKDSLKPRFLYSICI